MQPNGRHKKKKTSPTCTEVVQLAGSRDEGKAAVTPVEAVLLFHRAQSHGRKRDVHGSIVEILRFSLSDAQETHGHVHSRERQNSERLKTSICVYADETIQSTPDTDLLEMSAELEYFPINNMGARNN